MPFPTPRIRHFVPLSVLLFLHHRAPSFCPPLEHLPHQVPKNPYHFDKLLIRFPGFLPFSALLFLHRRAPSFYPSLQHLPHQFQKNLYHFDKLLIKITHKNLFLQYIHLFHYFTDLHLNTINASIAC